MQSKFPEKWLPYLLLFPTLLVSAVFLYYPAAQSFVLSLHKTAFLGLKKIYVGFENFAELFTSPEYLHSVWVSVLFAGGVVAIGMTLSFFIALLANQKIAGARIYRTLLVWPYALSPAVAGTIWLFLFNPTAGVVNYFTDVLFGIKPDWLSDGRLAMVMIIAAAVWKNLGYNIVFFLAGLQNIPGECLEAAQIDGAGAFQRTFRITIPLMSPTIFFLLIMNTIYAFFDTFGMIDVMTKGGPVDSTNILIYNLYRDAFENYRTGYAAAQSVILFVIVVSLTMLQFFTTGKRVHYGN